MKAGSRSSQSGQATEQPVQPERPEQPEQKQPVARPPQLKIWGRVSKLHSLERKTLGEINSLER